MRAGDDAINAVLLLRGVQLRDVHVLSFGFFVWWLSWDNRISGGW